MNNDYDLGRTEQTAFYSTEYSSPVGQLTIASDGTHLVGLWLNGQKYFLDTLPQRPTAKDDLAVFGQARNWLDHYFPDRCPIPESCR